jgi:hypothetical protein
MKRAGYHRPFFVSYTRSMHMHGGAMIHAGRAFAAPDPICDNDHLVHHISFP